MPPPKTLDIAVQLDLFREPPATPTWHQLPGDVRAGTRNLLARLLRDHRRTGPDVALRGEGRDE